MTEPSEARWTYRQRARDPRFPAVVLLMAAGASLGAAVFGYDLGAVVSALVVGSGVALLALPPWRDPRHGPAAGAAVLCVGALLVLVLAQLLR